MIRGGIDWSSLSPHHCSKLIRRTVLLQLLIFELEVLHAVSVSRFHATQIEFEDELDGW
jgi:hypothetical protein